MALQQYTPNVNQIVHTTGVDFNARPSIFKPVHIVQYDTKLPIIAVELYNNGNEYAAPSTANANIRFRKKGGTYVYNPALGYGNDRKLLYFEVTRQMAADYGDFKPIIELAIGDDVVGSSYINVIIDKNPIQDGDIESSDEYKSFSNYIDDAKRYAEQASASNSSAATHEANAKTAASAAQEAAKTVEDMRDDLETLNEMREDLLKTNSIRDPLLDSSGNSVFDSLNENIYGSIVFSSLSSVSDLVKRFNTLEEIDINELKAKTKTHSEKIEVLDEMRNDLLGSTDIRENLLDSSGNKILDDNGFYIYGRITLPKNDYVSYLEIKLNSVESVLNTLVSKVYNLSNHALLDNKF